MPTRVLILRGCGPKGYPGMPEVANLPLPSKLLAQGVRDMVRICDGRMSGTAYGTVVLHVAPEAADGGPLGRRRDRRHRSSSTCRRGGSTWTCRADVLGGATAIGRDDRRVRGPDAGLGAALRRPRAQADQGADLDFLVGASGSAVSRESH